MRRILANKWLHLVLVLCWCVAFTTEETEAEPANGINFVRRVRIQGAVTKEPLMCPLVDSMDQEMCDTDERRLDNFLMPDGAVCLMKEESGDVQFFECVHGAWESVSLRRGTSIETGRHKRVIGFILLLAFGGAILCVFLCRPRRPPSPTISCPYVPSEFFTDRGQRSKVIFWGVVNARGAGPELFRSQGLPPGSRFSEGRHRITYTVRDRHGRTSSCGFGFNVIVRRCSDWLTYYFPNGYVSCTDGNIYGSTCRYSCYYGYSLLGASTSTCEQSGWTYNKPSCAAISCGQPPYVINGRVSCGSVTFGSRCSVYCVTSGYVLRGSSTVDCSGNGQWTSPGVCYDVTPPVIQCDSQMLLYAGPLNEPVTTNWTTPSVKDNSNEPVAFASDPSPGTVMGVGVHVVTFTAVDRSGNSATCYMTVYVQMIKCNSRLLAVDFSNVTCTHGNVYGSVCSVGCGPDYYLEGESDRTCLENSTWSGDQARCIGLPCSGPPEVTNGNFTCERGYFYQEMCTLSCQKGFMPMAPLTITCDITWTPAGSCHDVQSPEFPDGCPPDMTYQASRLGEATYVTFGLPRVTDNSGQPLDIISEPTTGAAFDVGTTNVTVSAMDGSGNMASCSFRVKVTERSCDHPNFDPATKLLRYHCPDGHLFGATCTMSCPDGTHLPETITCDETEGGNLTWTHAGSTPPTCLGEVCPKLPDPENGALSCEQTTNQKYGPGIQCRMTCHQGHWLPKSVRDTLTCYKNIGVWSGSVHNCIKTKKPDQVQLAYKMTYNLASCTEDEGKKILATLQHKMKLSRVHAVCPEGWHCPMVSDFSCVTTESHASRDDEMDYNKLEIAVIVDLGQFDDSSDENGDLYDAILQEAQTAIIIDDEAGVLDLPAVGSPEEFTPPRLIYSCQPGTVFTTSTLSCIDCGSGYMYVNNTQTCVPCPQGTYQYAVTGFSCTKCPAGTTTRVSRATSLDQCIEICSPGTTSVLKTGLAPCAPCEIGTYQNSSWGKTCHLCPFGMTTGSAGSVSKDQCQFYNIWMSQGRTQAAVTLPDLRNREATFMMWLHLPIGSPQQALTFSFDPAANRTQLASLNIGHWTVYLGFEKSSVVRSWHHVTLVGTDQGNATLIVDGQEVDFTTADDSGEISWSSSLSFNASDTLKAVVITGVQMSNQALTLEEIGNYSKTCNRKLIDNVLTVQVVDKSLITPSTCDDINDCESDTCGQHGYCMDGDGHVTCICDEPWYGEHCESVLDFCHDHKCHQESICISEAELKKYTCQCNKGRKGTLCQEVAVNGMWSEWEPWGACNTSCGEGQRSRRRACDNPFPDPEGENCPGSGLEHEMCNGTQCPVKYGEWTEWSVWACSVTCGLGVSTRTRRCISLTQDDGGKCLGDADQHKNCNMSLCPVNGHFGQWSQWSQCSETCGGGKMSRERKCDSPAPSQGGLDCNTTEAHEIKPCNEKVCPACHSLSVKGQILSCGEDTVTFMTYCNISCSKGFELIPPESNQISCGFMTNYTWSHQNRQNPRGELPKCSVAKIPIKQLSKTRVVLPTKACRMQKSHASLIKSLDESLLKKNICPQNVTYNCSHQVKANCPTTKTKNKRSVDSVYVVVTLELELKDDRKAENEQDKVSESFFKFEEAVVRLLNNSEEIFQLNVDGVVLQGLVDSVQAEVTCQDGTGFYSGLCVDCPAGSYSVGNGSCFQCQKGFYQEQPRMTECQPCPEGLTTSGVGSSLLSECQKNPLSYEDIFWWASSDEEILNNYTLQKSKDADNFTGSAAENDQFLYSNNFIIIIVTCISFVAIVISTVVSCASLRSRYAKQQQYLLPSDEMSPLARDNPVYNMDDKPQGENFYSDMPVVLGFKHMYDTPSTTETNETDNPKESVPEPLAKVELHIYDTPSTTETNETDNPKESVPEPLSKIELPEVSELKAVLAVNMLFDQ